MPTDFHPILKGLAALGLMTFLWETTRALWKRRDDPDPKLK
jgi:hypothetical protein